MASKSTNIFGGVIGHRDRPRTCKGSHKKPQNKAKNSIFFSPAMNLMSFNIGMSAGVEESFAVPPGTLRKSGAHPWRGQQAQKRGTAPNWCRTVLWSNLCWRHQKYSKAAQLDLFCERNVVCVCLGNESDYFPWKHNFFSCVTLLKADPWILKFGFWCHGSQAARNWAKYYSSVKYRRITTAYILKSLGVCKLRYSVQWQWTRLMQSKWRGIWMYRGNQEPEGQETDCNCIGS
jgi:hypothetical protein